MVKIRHGALSITATLTVLFAPSFGFAQSKINQILIRAADLLRLMLIVVFTLAVISFGWGIMKLIASAGSVEGAKNAKSIIFWSIVGIVVLASIAGIIVLLQQFFGIENSSSIIPVFQF